MPNFPRTDLAVEAEAIHRSAAAVTELPGVRAEETNRRGFSAFYRICQVVRDCFNDVE